MSNLKNYYQSLPSEKKSEKKVFIEKIAEKTGKDTSTVYRWINGETEPSLLEKKEIAKIARKPIKELFNTKHHA